MTIRLHNIRSIISYLKLNGLTGLKIEFEAEGLPYDVSVFHALIAKENNLLLTVKLGGCDARNDMNEALTLMPDFIVAPVIESDFACKKFICLISDYNKLKMLFSPNCKFLINIESKTSIDNINQILPLLGADIKGIVFGRMDTSFSLGNGRSEVDSEQILSIANQLVDLAKKESIDLNIGGGISKKSISFLKTIYQRFPQISIETRKCIFQFDSIDDIKPEVLVAALKLELELLDLQSEILQASNHLILSRKTLLSKLI